MSYNSHVNDSKRSAGHGLEVGVLGSARLTENDGWWARAHKLGTLLAAEGFVLVTGGYGGLMAAVSRGAHETGGRVIGLPRAESVECRLALVEQLWYAPERALAL